MSERSAAVVPTLTGHRVYFRGHGGTLVRTRRYRWRWRAQLAARRWTRRGDHR